MWPIKKWMQLYFNQYIKTKDYWKMERLFVSDFALYLEQNLNK